MSQQPVGLPNQNASFWKDAGMVGQLGQPVIGQDGFVTMGEDFGTKRYQAGQGVYTWSRTKIPVERAQNYFWDMTDTMKGQWISELERATGRDMTKSTATIQREWNSYVLQAAAYNKAMNQEISPFELLKMNNDQLERMGKLPSQGGGGASGYSSVVNLTNPSDAKILIDNALQQYLGRAATEEESTAFMGTLNSIEKKNPLKSTPGSRSGGVNPQQVAKEVAMADENYAETAVNSTYMNWLVEGIQNDPTKGIESGL